MAEKEPKETKKSTFNAEKEYTFLRTYLGAHGKFFAGKKYKLTKEQFEALESEVKE
jgi:hypothetical protein